MNRIKIVGNVQVWQDENALLFKTGAAICGDGSPHCYAPNNKGLDYTANAGNPGNWWGIATDSNGSPIVQSIYDVAPGFYVSTTAQVIPDQKDGTPERYIDAERYPYVVVPGNFGYGWQCGDVGFCLNQHTNDNMYCATCDIGPKDSIGEVSMLLAKCLALDYNPKRGGISDGIVYVVFPGSDSTYKPWRQKCQIAIDTFTKWGGLPKLTKLIPQL